MDTPRTDYDGAWKEILGDYLRHAFAMLFPAIHDAIDWSRPIRFLDAELQRLVGDADAGMIRADRLVEVYRRDGTPARVLVHVEAQNQVDPRFARRMYDYHHRIRDGHGGPVASLALLGDERPSWRPDVHEEGLWGCETLFRFPIAKLADWRGREAELEASDNPFAVVLLAHLAAQDTRGDADRRQAVKLGLIRRLYARGWDRERVLGLLRFIDWLLALPAALEDQVRAEIVRIEEEHQVRYIPSYARAEHEQGLQQGLQQGREEGLQRGRMEAKRQAVRRLLQARFPAIPEPLEGRIAAADEPALDALFDRALAATSAEEL